MTPQEQAIHTERQEVYGPWAQNMIGTSQQIAGLLTQMYANGHMLIDKEGIVSISPWAAPLFMLAFKSNRMASGNHHADNFVDLKVYAEMVERFQRETAGEEK